MIRWRGEFSVLCCALGTLAAPAQAARIDDRYWLQIAAFRPSINTIGVANVADLPNNGTLIDFEDDLGLRHTEWLPAVEAGLRLGNRWRLEGEYYRLGRSAQHVLARDIVWDGIDYAAGATLDAEFNTSVWRATLGYSFVKNDRFELGADIGAHLTNFTAAISGQGSINDVNFTLSRQAHDEFVPLPTIGAFVTYDIDKVWSLQGRLDWLSLSVGDYSGGVTDIWATVNARFVPHVGVGAGWRYVNYHLGVNRTDWNGYIRYQYSGPTVYVTFAF